MSEKPSPARSAAPAEAVAASPAPAESKRRSEGSILLATNGSEEGDAATRFAIALARREGLPVRIITVLEPLPSLPSEFTTSGYHFEVERERGEQVLTHAKAEATEALEPRLVETSMLIGSPAGTIASAARSWRSGYVVLGAGRRGRVERLFSGDTAVRVLRDAIVPVIAVPATCGELPRIAVVAVDFGPASLRSARAAANIVAEGVMHLVHVRPEIDIPATDPSAWADLYESGARALLTRLAKELGEEHPGLRFETALGRGHAAEAVLDYADGVNAELIAVGQHAHGAVERLLFGSVASGIVRAAHCSVLVAPAVR
jgi:nucleotide-binding universal stress UspA family protein